MVFVTGGTGLLGSHLLAELCQKEGNINALYRTTARIELVKGVFKHYFPENWENFFNKINWIEGDILDLVCLDENIVTDAEVYHCAGLVSFHSSDFQNLMKINREGTANIVNVCLSKNVKKLCYVSSTAALGSKQDGLINESDLWKKTPTTSSYSISKYLAEKEVWRGIEEGLNAVMVNPCVILGAGNWNDSSLAIFKTLEKGMSFYPSGSNSQVDARDVSSIMYQLMKSSVHSERFLCIGTNQSIQDLMSIIADKIGKKRPSKLAPKWLSNIGRILMSLIFIFKKGKPSITKETVQSMYGHRAYSNKKIQSELDYSFYSIDETIENAINGRIQLS